MSRQISCSLLVIALLAFCSSAIHASLDVSFLDDYLIRVSGEPGNLIATPGPSWPHVWNSDTQSLSLLNGYAGPDWRKVFSIELWVSGDAFDPNSTVVPVSDWIDIGEAYGSVPGGITYGFCQYDWEPYLGGYHYGFKGYICPQPEGEIFNFGRLGHVDRLDVRTTCVPGTCVPEPSSCLALLMGSALIIFRRRR